MNRKTKGDYLWLVFFIIIFINGFESGGYQASLLDIGKTYDLSTTSKGIFASVELFATMLAPIILGAWADRSNKLNFLKLFLIIQLATSFMITILTSRIIFLGAMFIIGLTTSALQFVAIAALVDYYPLSGNKKIGYLTSMYALGAFVAPLVVAFYLHLGFSWRTLFASMAITSAIAVFGLVHPSDTVREDVDTIIKENAVGKFILPGILMLCIVMCIYVGYENGFAFFIDTLFAEEFASSLGKYALSIFWIVMIPSRVMVGHTSKHSSAILICATIAIPTITFIIAQLSSDIAVFLLCIPLGFACGSIYPCVLTLAMPFAGAHKATATGMITTATGIGAVVFTALTGYMGEKWDLKTAVVFLSYFFVISLAAVILLAHKFSKNLTSE